MLFETCPGVTWSFPVVMTSFPVHPGCHGNISGPVTSFPGLASIPCSAELSVPVPKNRPRGQTGHVGQIRLSDWLKFEMLASDWLPGKPTPFTTLLLPQKTDILNSNSTRIEGPHGNQPRLMWLPLLILEFIFYLFIYLFIHLSCGDNVKCCMKFSWFEFVGNEEGT